MDFRSKQVARRKRIYTRDSLLRELVSRPNCKAFPKRIAATVELFLSFRYLVNRYFVEQLAQTPVKAVEVQYVNQTFEGDRLPIYACGENRYSIRKDGQLAVNCSFCLAAETETTE